MRASLFLATLGVALTSQAGVVNWTNTNGGNWSGAANWSGGTVPSSGEDVFITAPGIYTVTQDVNVAVASLTLGGVGGTQTLTNAAANLTLNSASAVNATGVLCFGGGTLGGTGVLTVSGKVAWNGGTIVGAVTVASNGTLEIGGSGTKYLSGAGTLLNYGSVAWSGPNDIQTGNFAQIINQPGALFDIQNNQSLAIANGGAITNLGTMRKSAGGGNTLITVPLYNSGTLDVQSGSVAYGAGSHFNDATAFIGAGTNRVYAGVITFNGGIYSTNLEIGGGTIAGNGVFSGSVNWTGGDLTSGTLTVAANGKLNICASTIKHLSGTGSLINYGSVVWSGTNDIQTGNSARIINQPGALFEIQNNQSLAIANGGTITNLGTIRKTAGEGNTLITVPLYNFGTLDVQSGLVAYGGGSQFSDGTAFIGEGTNLVSTGTMTFNGAIASENLEIGGPTIGGNGVFSGTANWTSGDLQDGTLTIATNGVLNIRGSGTKNLLGTGTLINYGLIAWSGSNNLNTLNHSRIINQPGALFEIQNNQSFTIWNGGAITNLGTLRKSAGGGNTLIAVPLYNFGTLDVQSGSVAYGAGSQFNEGTAFLGAGTNLVYTGTVSFNGAIASENLEIGGPTIGGNGVFSGILNWTSGDLQDSTLTIATNGVLNIRGSGTKNLWGTGTLINYGLIAWSGSNDLNTLNYSRIINQPGALFEIQNNQSFTIWNGGAITNLGTIRKSAGGGNTLITVPAYNSGTVDVQSGTMTFETFTQTGGTFSFGLNSPTNFGRLAFTHNIALNGTLAANLTGGFLPKAGDAFAVITYPNHTGAFTTFDLPTVAAWETNSSIYSASAVTLSVLNAQPSLATIPPQTGNEETAIRFTASASDLDAGQILTFSLIGQPGGASINPTSGNFSWTPTEAQGPSTNTFVVQVADNGSPALTATQSVTVLVNEVNLPPTLVVPPTQTFDELTRLAVTNVATDTDLPANSLHFSLISAPAGVNLNTNTGVLTWTPSEAQGPSTNLIVVAVTDSNPWAVNAKQLSVTNSFTVVVLESNSAPVLAAIPELTAIQDVLLTFTNLATDPDLPTNSLRFDLIGFPPGMTINPTSGVLTWTPTGEQAPSTNYVTVRVIDDGTPALSDEQPFTVVAYPLPRLSFFRTTSNALVTWPGYARSFRLEAVTNLSVPACWSEVTNAIGEENGCWSVTESITGAERYYRLHHP